MLCLFKGSLKDRHIENGSELYAMFTPSENLLYLTQRQAETNIKNEGPSVIRCHIMLQVLLIFYHF